MTKIGYDITENALVVVAAHIGFRFAIHADDELGFALLHPRAKPHRERRIDVDGGLAALGCRALVFTEPLGNANLRSSALITISGD